MKGMNRTNASNNKFFLTLSFHNDFAENVVILAVTSHAFFQPIYPKCGMFPESVYAEWKIKVEKGQETQYFYLLGSSGKTFILNS